MDGWEESGWMDRWVGGWDVYWVGGWVEELPAWVA